MADKKQRKRSFQQQMFNAIDSRYKVGQGRSKHQDKMNKANKKHDIIYMSGEHKNIKDTINEVGRFIKQNYPEYWREQLDKIPIEVFDQFLETKKDCSQNTINSYKGRIEKAFRCAAATYKTGNFEHTQYINTPLSDRSEEATLRDIAIGRDVLELALRYMDKGSGGFRGNKIASMFGPRIFEIEKIQVRDVNFNDNTLVIQKGKGSKRRVYKMTNNQAAVMKDLCKDKKPAQRVCGCGQDAIQRGLTRALERIDKEFGTDLAQQLKEKKTNTHAIRKLIATEEFNRNLAFGKLDYIKGIVAKDAENATKNGLSDELLNKYGGDIRKVRPELLDKFCRENFIPLTKRLIDKKTERRLEHEAWGPVSENLGHGFGRWELKETYVITNKTKILTLPEHVKEQVRAKFS